MKVILLADVPKVGKKSEIKNVSVGFAKNFLFPRGFARAVTSSILAELEKQSAAKRLAAEKELAEAEKLAKALDGLEVEIAMKVSSDGTGYAAISAQKITEILHKLGFEIKKNQIEIKEPIKKIGEYPVSIALNHGLEAEVKIVAVAETKNH